MGGSGLLGVKVPVPADRSRVHVPATAVPRLSVSTQPADRAPGSKVTLKTGDLSLPLTAGALTATAGADVSSRYVAAALVLLLPATSVTVIVKEYASPGESGSGLLGVNVPLPPARSGVQVPATAVPRLLRSVQTTVWAAGSKVKPKAGTRSLPVAAGELAAAAGAVVSSTYAAVALCALPASSVTRTVKT